MSFFILWGSGGSMEATYGALHWKLYFCSQMVAYQGNYRVGWVRGRQPVNPMTSWSHGSRKPQMTLAREKGEGCVKLMVRTILDHVLIANHCCLSPSLPYRLYLCISTILDPALCTRLCFYIFFFHKDFSWFMTWVETRKKMRPEMVCPLPTRSLLWYPNRIVASVCQHFCLWRWFLLEKWWLLV